MCVFPSLFKVVFVVGLNLTCPCNNIFPNRMTVAPRNPSPLGSWPYKKGLLISGQLQTWGHLLRASSREDPVYGDLPWTTERVDKAGREGTTGPLVPAGGPHHRHGDGFHPGVFTVRVQPWPSKLNKGWHCLGSTLYINQMTCIPRKKETQLA